MDTSVTPPEFLFHGTLKDSVNTIIRDGIIPKSKQKIPLSTDFNKATMIGKRKGDNIVILLIKSRRVFDAGHNFYRSNEETWLADQIPADFLEIF